MSTPDQAIKALVRQHFDDPDNPAIKQHGPTIADRDARLVFSYIEALEQTRDARCEWTSQGPPEWWNSGCGHEFCTEDADEAPNWMKFCPYCGGAAIFPSRRRD